MTFFSFCFTKPKVYLKTHVRSWLQVWLSNQQKADADGTGRRKERL